MNEEVKNQVLQLLLDGLAVESTRCCPKLEGVRLALQLADHEELSERLEHLEKLMSLIKLKLKITETNV